MNNNFKKLSLYRRMTMPLDELEAYCREMRYARYEREGGFIDHLWLHTVLHYPLILLLKVSRLFERRKIIVVRDNRIKTNKPVIFAPTHIGGDDIVTAFETLRTTCWLVLGDPHEMYRNFNGLMLKMNGVIGFDTLHKQDRRIAKERMRTLLQKGGNLLMFPEGAWNVTPDKTVCPLYAGAVELSIDCNAEIVPVAILKSGNTYYVDVGKNIGYTAADAERKYELTTQLRDTLATMQWTLIEKYAPIKRVDISENYFLDVFWKEIQGSNERLSYSLQDAFDTMFRPKNVIDYDEAFGHLQNITPTLNNAFLFRKSIK